MSEKEKKRPAFDESDDGGTIANMDVDGMPWMVRSRYKNRNKPAANPESPLSKEEQKAYRWAAVKSALVVILTYGIVFFLFIAFCYFVWFNK